MCFLPRESALRKNSYFTKFRAPSFLQCVFYHLRHGRQKKKRAKGLESGFWDLQAHFEVQGARNFWFGMRHNTAGFYHVLSASVVPLVSVESAMESKDVLMTCFCAVSSSGTHRSPMITIQKKPPLAATQAFEPADPSTADFLEHLTAACPRSVIHASQKCPQFCGIGTAPRGDAMSPSERSLCNHRVVVDCGKPSVVAIFVAPKTRVAPWRNAPLWIPPCREKA